MAKRIKVRTVYNLDEIPIKIPEFDSEGQLILVDDPTRKDSEGNPIKVPKTRHANTIDLLEVLIRQFPRERLTMENITHATRLKSQIIESKKRNDGILVIEEAEHDWVKKMLRDEKVGVEIFGINLMKVIEAVEDFERPHESKEE
jgi:hypothetical protein